MTGTEKGPGEIPAPFGIMGGAVRNRLFGLEPALEPGSRIRMDDPFLAGPVDQLFGFGKGFGPGVRIGHLTNRFDRGAKLAALASVDGGAGLGLAHPLFR